MDQTSSTLSSRFFIGLIIICLGVGFFMDSIGMWNFGTILGQWWPAIFILIGLANLMNPTHNKVGPVILIGIGLLLLSNTLNYWHGDVWTLIWPSILILIGASIVFGHPLRTLKSDVSSEKSLDIAAIFSGVDRVIDTKDFNGGNITAIFGGAKIDLRKAKMAPNATLNCTTIFGGTELIVAEDCYVRAQGTPIFGGWEDKTTHPSDTSNKLLITGTSVFGGISIKN